MNLVPNLIRIFTATAMAVAGGAPGAWLVWEFFSAGFGIVSALIFFFHLRA
jgi:hypothetical protein